MATQIKNTNYDLDHYGDKLGDTLGSTMRGVVFAVNPFVGAAMEGGHLIRKAMPHDEFGIDKTEFTAAFGNAMDPTSTWDTGIKDLGSGKVGKGLVELFAPGFGGVLQMRGEKEELRDFQGRETINTTVGDFNPLAGRFSGNATGTNTIVEKSSVNALNDRKFNIGDGVEAAAMTASFAKGVKSGSIDLGGGSQTPEITDPQSVSNIEGELSKIKDPSVQATTADILGVNSSVQNPLDVKSFDVNNNNSLGDLVGVSKFNANIDSMGLPSPINPNGDSMMQGLSGGGSDVFNWGNKAFDTAMKFKGSTDIKTTDQYKNNKEKIDSYSLEGLSVGMPLLMGNEGFNY